MITTSPDTILERPPTRHQLAIVVTHEHIRNGARGVGSRCAMRLAFVDAGYPLAIVNSDEVYRVLPRYRVLKLPAHVQNWIRRFDTGQPVEPERFLIDLPERES